MIMNKNKTITKEEIEAIKKAPKHSDLEDLKKEVEALKQRIEALENK